MASSSRPKWLGRLALFVFIYLASLTAPQCLAPTNDRSIALIESLLLLGVDFSHAPAVVDRSGTKMDKFNRPTEEPVTMRLDSPRHRMAQKADGRGSRPKRLGFCDKP
jgi:hypothetical protein